MRLSETGEMIGKVVGIADRNTTFLDITGLTPGQYERDMQVYIG